MAYNKTTWVNGSVPVDEDHLNNIEDGIEGATQDAENAQSSADKAQESADNAQSTAEEAQSAADKAQETAESANTAAGDAQAAAEAAQDTAASAQATAEKAQETADSANEAVSSEATERQSADSDLEEKIQENTDLIDSFPIIQIGSFVASSGSIAANNTTTLDTITFPQAFTSAPYVFLQLDDISSVNYGNISLSTSSITTTSFAVKVHNVSSSSTLAPRIRWMAIQFS